MEGHIISNAGIKMERSFQIGERMITTYQSPTKFVECALCKRITSESHAQEIDDFWICSWCGA